MIILGSRVAIGREYDALVAQKFVVHSGIFVGRYAQDNAIAGGNVLLQPVQRGSLFHAGRTPSGPKIQHNNLALIVREAPRLPGNLQRKLLRGFTRNRVFALAVARHSK